MPFIYYPNITSSPDDFLRLLKKECTDCLQKQEAFTVAFLAFHLVNPEIVKMLSDEALWNAINQESGNKMTLFYINPEDLIKKTYAEGTKDISNTVMIRMKTRYSI